MKGCRPLNRHERRAVLSACPDLRTQALFTLGFATGFRISELLSIRISDVLGTDWLVVRHTKNGEGRTVKLNSAAAKAATALANHLLGQGARMTDPLFGGRKGQGHTSLSRQHAWRLIKAVFDAALIRGAVATHTLRKTFAAEMYRLLNGAIEKVAVALGHKSITSTVAYLSFRHSDIDDAIMNVEF